MGTGGNLPGRGKGDGNSNGCVRGGGGQGWDGVIKGGGVKMEDHRSWGNSNIYKVANLSKFGIEPSILLASVQGF